MKRPAAAAAMIIFVLAQLACTLPLQLPSDAARSTGMVVPSPTRLPETPAVMKTAAVQPTAAPILPAPTRPAATLAPLASPAGEGRVSDKDGFYSLSVPVGFAVTARGNGYLMCADEKGSTCLAVTLRTNALYPEYVLENVLRSLEARNLNFVEVSRIDIAIGNYAGLLSKVKYTQNNLALEGEVRVVTRNRVGYELNLWYPAGKAAAAQAAFGEVIKSFSITEFKEAPIYEEWKETFSENLVFYTLPGSYADVNIKTIAAVHEKAYVAIQQTLEVDYFEPIFYYLYPNDKAFFQSTYRSAGFAIDEGGEVHARWYSAQDHQTVGHEMTHVIAFGTLGYAGQALMGEGLAVCLDQDNRDYRQAGRALVGSGKYVPLAKMMGEDWYAVDPTVAYPQSGAFVCYLLEKHGTMFVWDLYVSEDLNEAAQLSLGMSLTALEKDFLAWLGQ